MANKLEESPEFQAALNEACDKQHRGWLYGGSAVKAETKTQIDSVMRELQSRKRGAEQMRESLALRATAMDFHMSDIPSLPDEITLESLKKYQKEMHRHSDRIMVEADRRRNPHFQEITKNLSKRTGSSGLVCPMCGEGDHGNRMGKKPVCMMNAKHKGLGLILLVKPEDVKDWKPPKKKFKPKEAWELAEDKTVKVRGKKR